MEESILYFVQFFKTHSEQKTVLKLSSGIIRAPGVHNSGFTTKELRNVTFRAYSVLFDVSKSKAEKFFF